MTTTWWLLPILLFAWLLLWWVTRTKGLSEQERSIILRKWKEVEALMEEKKYRYAVLEADKTLDFVMRRMHIAGETFAKRFKKAESSIGRSEEVWAAHKMRNQLVHDIDFEINSGRAANAIDSFHRALKKLNAL
ncbi:hypothetical protein A2810_00365 [candidate division Kazan bacterium RIFCSPHIGHO2_01_FULL_49_10]|uniref:DUF4145 domain-containing protein n=1 Tax=candidate division Kazan bacterium RIFCSPLOWO2_01_FULL_48_13 TaxID=1798539 RepID=A0A1F4PPF3_UNCK3|nr:MAG: hypothetical protein A2810_00365 [candidate division Kazan bacterium RIFCSPHIGHO2_01_FULL_49_10]OGB85551.1 MAG: hypothetical protein A2994_00815 [candidate division Kazan bacterium RIFCSPLOWO2_01_FULL_48_13]